MLTFYPPDVIRNTYSLIVLSRTLKLVGLFKAAVASPYYVLLELPLSLVFLFTAFLLSIQ